MSSRSQDELIGDTLAMVNVVRQAFGKPELSELPDAAPGDAGNCLFYRALSDVGVQSVVGGSMSFVNERVASAVSAIWGTDHKGTQVATPRQFTDVIAMFDDRRLPHYHLGR